MMRPERRRRPTRPREKSRVILNEARGIGEWVTIYQAYHAIFRLAELALLRQRVSLPQLHLLAILRKAGGILSAGEIAREMVKSSQTITGLVDRLEEPGFVERVFDRDDRRKIWISLTKKGDRKLADAFPIANRLAEELFSVLTDEELQELRAKVEKLRSTTTARLAATLNPGGSIRHGRGVQLGTRCD